MQTIKGIRYPSKVTTPTGEVAVVQIVGDGFINPIQIDVYVPHEDPKPPFVIIGRKLLGIDEILNLTEYSLNTKIMDCVNKITHENYERLFKEYYV